MHTAPADVLERARILDHLQQISVLQVLWTHDPACGLLDLHHTVASKQHIVLKVLKKEKNLERKKPGTN
eukprot:3089762-Amphidinium_carterae.1